MDLKERTSEELSNEIVKKLKYCKSQWIVPADVENFVDVEPHERKKMKQVMELLVFRKVLRFNKEYLLWENLYWRKNG